MNRREFLGTSVFAATAGLALDACAPEATQLIPILIPEEPFIPGKEIWTRSTCFECTASCGIEVRKIDGRLVKVEGNPEHPMSRGGLCARGQAIPQAMYHPDRIQTPLEKQSDGSWTELSWDDALGRVASSLSARDDLAFLTGSVTGHRREIVRRFLQAFGSTRHLVHNPFPLHHPVSDVDIDNASYVVSFGAEFLESHVSPVRFARGLAALRQSRPGRRGKFVMVGPRLSLTAANADEWVPARAGEELDIALGIARVLIRDGLHEADDVDGFRELTALVASLEPSPEVERLAHEMAENRPAIAIAGGGGGTALAAAVSNLNALLGTQTAQTSAPPFEPWPAMPGGDPPVAMSLTSAFNAEPPAVLFVADTNPLYSLPPAFELGDWLSSIQLKVSFASIVDETSAACDLVLPESMSFERFEDAVPEGAPVPMATLSQPLLVRPLYDTRAMPDALIEIAKRADHGESFPWSSYEAALRAAFSSLGSWSQVLARGGWWDESATPEHDRTRPPYRFDTTALASRPERTRVDLELHVYASTAFGDGRSARLPYLQELSDPITGVRWGSVVEIATDRADALGITSGDIVEVSSEWGTLEAAAYVTPGIHPHVIAIAAGQGHTNHGRYANGRGVNAFSLLGRSPDGTSVSVRKVSS